MFASVSLSIVAVIAAGENFTCTHTRVWDADGPIWCAEGPRIRLHGIAAREMDGTCRPGHPCPAMGPIEARNILVKLLQPVTLEMASAGHVTLTGAPPLSCISYGTAKGNRTAARCATKDNKDIACELVASSAAVEWLRYSEGRYSTC